MCAQENSQDIKLEMKTVLNVFENNFFIPSYQRGYRWTESEVTLLLNDIYANKDKNYCLQPVVVKKRNDNTFELIDGQQRITTLFLLLQYIKTAFHIPFALNTALEYETRENSAEYLKEITKQTNNAEQTKKVNDNIDFYHMHNALITITEWFNNKNASEQVIAAFEIFVALSKTVQVIWYETSENENSIDLFTRLNIGKIPLTNAELVKALFLTDKNTTELQKQEIAYQWDYIEKELHDEIFWNFLTKHKNFQTRIDLVLNLVAASENEKGYNTFFYFDKNKDKLSEHWDNTVQTFYLLKEWYEDYELYHKIGYLIVTGGKNTLLELYNLAKEETKPAFKNQLSQKIEESIGKPNNIDSFSYDWKFTKNLLLLFNVETICQTNDNSYRFPFHTYNKLIWSIEHIHAQNSEVLPKEEWKKWIEEYKPWIENFKNSIQPNNQEKIKEIEEINKLIKKFDEQDFDTINENDFTTLQDKVFKLFSDNEESSIHSIDNLALLGKNNNSSLNNAIFPIKRDKIIQMDKDGKFIPPCTKNVFLKYYTSSEKEQNNYWGQNDRDAYKDAIVKTLNKYGIKEEK